MRKFCTLISHIFMAQQLENACKEFVWELKFSHSILVNDLCGKELYIVIFRNMISFSKASK